MVTCALMEEMRRFFSSSVIIIIRYVCGASILCRPRAKGQTTEDYDFWSAPDIIIIVQ